MCVYVFIVDHFDCGGIKQLLQKDGPLGFMCKKMAGGGGGVGGFW